MKEWLFPLQIVAQVICSQHNLSTSIRGGNNEDGLLKSFLRMGLKALSAALLV